jgi:hypothetical protein
MRSVLIAVAALSLSTPAFAASETARDAKDMADKMNSPQMQSAMAGMMGTFIAAILDMRVDGLAKAVEPMTGKQTGDFKGKTVRDFATKDDPDFERKMQAGTKAAVGSMGAMASALAVMLPQIEDAARKMEKALPQTR